MEQKIPGKSKATASMVLGIISLVVAWFGWGALVALALAVVGLILGIQAKKELPPNQPRGMATAGIVCSIIGIVLSCFVFVSCILCVSAIGAADAAGLFNNLY